MDSFAASLSSESALSLQSLFRVLPAVYQELELLLSHLKAIAEPVQEDLTLVRPRVVVSKAAAAAAAAALDCLVGISDCSSFPIGMFVFAPSRPSSKQSLESV